MLQKGDTMSREYEAKVVETSMELTAKQRVMLKDTSDAIKIDESAKVEDLIIDVADYAVIDIHNSQAENTDYSVYVLIDQQGQRYVTGSDVFFEKFKGIWDEMKDSGEDWQLRCFRAPSKSRSGQFFLNCTII